MKSFLSSVAEHLYVHHKGELQEMCMVFPNRRSIIYFRKYLSEQLQTTEVTWAPEMMTINDLMHALSNMQLADSMDLIFDLFDIYKKHKKTDESFDNFYSWGEVLLSDFDELDKNLVNAGNLFRNLSDIKSIDNDLTYLSDEQREIIMQFWGSFKGSNQFVYEQEFVGIWTVLYSIYKDFRQQLFQSGKAYEGMIFRDVAERISLENKFESGYKKIAFVGLNALNTCEKKLLKHLKSAQKALFYWDYDQYYLDNDKQEAGFFIRDNLKNFPPEGDFIFKTDNINQSKKIDVISVPSSSGQAKLTGQILSSEWSGADINNTVVVLSDENLLQPMLASVPDSVEDINITMGYPVRQTQVYNLIESLIGLQQNARKNKSGEVIFYHSYVTAILMHPLIRQSSLDGDVIQKLLLDIRDENKITIKKSDISDFILQGKIFKLIDNTESFQEYLLDILITLGKSITTLQDSNNADIGLAIEIENLFQVITTLQKLKNIISAKKINIALTTYYRLLRRYLNMLRIPYSGEPLKGLQVMGILETRCLDFQNLCILSMNEGVLPKRSAGISYIPFNLRKAFGLTTIEHQDAIYAYYFYRLLQRAENVKLIYCSNQEGLVSGEESRYILQLKYESGIEIYEKQAVYSITTGKSKKIEIPKSEEILNNLMQYSQGLNGRYLSPSAINTYIECPLRFYFKQIAGLEEKVEVSDEIDHALFGNLLHNIMNSLYEEFTGGMVQSGQLEEILKHDSIIKTAIIKAFVHEKLIRNEGEELYGNALIVEGVLEKMVRQIIRIDIRIAPFKIIALEKKFSMVYPIGMDLKTIPLTLGGRFDRIDEVEGKIRIIDYKTGMAESRFENMESLFLMNSSKQNKAVFQLMLYSMIYQEVENKGAMNLNITPGIYSTRKLYQDDFDCRLELSKNKIDNAVALLSEFNSGLDQILQNIYNFEIPFTQTSDIKTCEKCPYAGICHK